MSLEAIYTLIHSISALHSWTCELVPQGIDNFLELVQQLFSYFILNESRGQNGNKFIDMMLVLENLVVSERGIH